VTLIINIYGLGVGISTIKKFTSCRGVGFKLIAWFHLLPLTYIYIRMIL
jgi:hypothetical protein